MGVATLTVRRWERGTARPQPALLRKLCAALAASPADLGFDVEPAGERASERNPTVSGFVPHVIHGALDEAL